MSVSLSFFIGLLFTTLLFVLSTLFVLGGKLLIITYQQRFSSPTKKQRKPRSVKPKPTEEPKQKPSSPVAVRTIEINPDEIDQIFVKKTS